ncbi:MAG: pirin family protein [Gemmataceae bacterium]
MITIRKAADRGHADHGWLNSYHTFSFAGYSDPDHMGFRTLRVMNEDRVSAGKGFGTHAHRDMEIVSYVLAGVLEHKDSMGNGEQLVPGEFQRITAGTGITHSEFNPSTEHPTHFYQIWLLPEKKGLAPSYEQKAFDSTGRHNKWQLVASREGNDGALTIHQDARIFLANIDEGQSIDYAPDEARHVWIQVLRGSVNVNDHSLETSDGLAASNETNLMLNATSDSEIMLFDLA